MFPGVTLKKTFHGIDISWGISILLTSYNLGDIVGKYLGGIKFFIKKYMGYAIVLSRFVFFFLLLVISTNNEGKLFENDYFAILVTFFFAVTNGLATSIFINGFMLSLGITCGTFTALIFKNSDKWKYW